MDFLPPGLPPSTAAPLVRGLGNLFVVAQQLDDRFLSDLLEHPVTSDSALLSGYRRVTLASFSWPIIVPAEGCQVRGRLVRDLEAEDFFKLDAYQGLGEGLYRRCRVDVAVDGERAAAYAYLPTDKVLRQLPPRG
jgi:hypothetical protein